jgi:hypothetical protein
MYDNNLFLLSILSVEVINIRRIVNENNTRERENEREIGVYH